MAKNQVNLQQIAGSTGVQSLANAGNAGGTMYYINLGGLRMLWGTTPSLTNAANTETAFNITLPASFFTTIQSVTFNLIQASGSVANNIIIGNSYTTSTISIFLRNNTASPGIGGAIGYMVIGT